MNFVRASVFRTLATAAVTLGVASCGGGYGGGGYGGGGGSGDYGDPPPGGPPGGPPSATTYTVGGTVAGLLGTGLKISTNGAELSIATAGAFTFPTALANGTAYNITVVTQPTSPTQNCVPTGGSGIVNGSNVNNVIITCTTTALPPLELLESTPEPGTKGVSRTVLPTIKFSASLDAATAQSAISMRNLDGDQPVTVSVAGDLVTIQPANPLAPLRPYLIDIDTTLRGSAGEPLTDSAAIHFTTADGAWQTAAPIETDAAEATAPQIAMNPDGAAISSWTQAKDAQRRAWIRRYRPGFGWDEPRTIDSDTKQPSQPVFSTKVALNGRGNAVAVWNEVHGTVIPLMANSSTEDDNWGTPTQIGLDGNVRTPQVAIDGDGNAIVVWQENKLVAGGGTVFTILASRYLRAEQRWTTAEQISTDEPGAALPQVAFAPNGDAVAVWQQVVQGRRSIVARRCACSLPPSTDSWGEIVPIDNADGGGSDGVQIKIDGAGIVLAVWTQGGIRMNHYNPIAARWGEPRRIDNGSTMDVGAPQLAIDRLGNAIAVWQQTDQGRKNIYANAGHPLDAWPMASARTIENLNDGDAGDPQIAIDIQGNAIVVWEHGSTASSNILWNRFDSIERRWGTEVHALDPTFIGHALSPQIAIDSKGNALAVWQAEDTTIPGPTIDVIVDRFE